MKRIDVWWGQLKMQSSFYMHRKLGELIMGKFNKAICVDNLNNNSPFCSILLNWYRLRLAIQITF